MGVRGREGGMDGRGEKRCGGNEQLPMQKAQGFQRLQVNTPFVRGVTEDEQLSHKGP